MGVGKGDLSRVFSYELDCLPPFSFDLTVNKKTRFGVNWYWITPYEKYYRGTMWSGVRLYNNKPVGLKVKALGTVQNPKILLEVFSEDRLSNREEKEILEIIDRCLGLKDDITSFYTLAERFPYLRQSVEDLYGMRICSFPDFFSAVILAVTLQMASYGRTERMIKLLYRNYGEKIVFDNVEVIVCPSPTRITNVSEEELKGRCNLGYRAAFIKACAEAVVSQKAPTIKELADMKAEEAKRVLMSLKGIGEYSAEIITPHPSFPVDVWSVKIFCQLFKIKVDRSLRAMIPIVKRYAFEKFGRWQKYVYTYITNDLEKLPEKFKLNI
ncbi:MAG: DNA-3-methyladenine glycosylase family protein [Candidatus Baldrarchaeia archaeon]